MQDLEKEIKMEDKQKEEEGGTPAPSQENDVKDNSANDNSVNDNSDLTPEEFDKQIEEALNNSQSSEPTAKEGLDENSNPVQNVEDNSSSENNSPALKGNAPEQDDSNQNDLGQNGLESNPQENDVNNAPKAEEKMLSQSQVNELVGKARKEGRESALKELMSRYGVNGEDELDTIFGRGQAYDDLDYDYQNQGKSYKDAMAENALLKSHIDESRWEDVKSILGFKGLEVNAENISALLPTHQEWLGLSNNGSGVNNGIGMNGIGVGQENQILTQNMAEQMVDNQYRNASSQLNTKKPGVLKKLGNEPEPVSRAKTEEEEAAELYGW